MNLINLITIFPTTPCAFRTLLGLQVGSRGVVLPASCALCALLGLQVGSMEVAFGVAIAFCALLVLQVGSSTATPERLFPILPHPWGGIPTFGSFCQDERCLCSEFPCSGASDSPEERPFRHGSEVMPDGVAGTTRALGCVACAPQSPGRASP